jgi:hypothetical protein
MNLFRGHSPLAAIAVLLALTAAPAFAADDMPPALAILQSRCVDCHAGPKAPRGLVMTDPAAISRGSKSGRVIQPGNPDASMLWQKIAADEMPPESPLPAEEKEILRAWIAEGAPGLAAPGSSPEAEPVPHWAFISPRRPPLPTVNREDWAKSAIDHFILARLEKENLQPSSRADRITLLRRLHLDLTGLPPTIGEIDAALADETENWYAAAIERLLASPHYGERWARHWLDAAQYADSDGFEKDKPRQVWAWRDWVINALNENKPYDQFVIEQVAGDVLPDATQAQIIATGFLRNSMINEEGGIDPEQFRMEAQFNRMDIIGRAVLGLTIGCAQCHTHKYDPIQHTEYYQMFAFLNNAHEANITVLSDDERRERAEILSLVDEIENRIKRENPDWRERVANWETESRNLARPTWETLALVFDDTSAGGQKCLPQNDGSYLAQGYAPTRFDPKMTTKSSLKKITAVRLELLPDPNLPRGGPGRSVYGSAALSEFEMRTAPEGTPIAEYDKWTPVEFSSAIATVNPAVRQLGPEYPTRNGNDARVTGPIAMAIDKKRETAWTTDIDPLNRNEPHTAIFILAKPLELAPNTTIAFVPVQQHGGWNSDDNQNNNLGRFRISVTDAEKFPDRLLPEKVEAALAAPPGYRSEAQQRAVFAAWRSGEPQFGSVNSRIESLLHAMPSGGTQLVFNERDRARTTHRLDRGDFLSPKEEVTPGVPAFLHKLNSEGPPTRLDFARWLVSRDSPTTARAFVNRVWLQYFGEGLVSTPSDLGTQGEEPSHPELLDWLAVEFMESGWDIKNLHRLIVNSETYKQSSNVTPDLLERDPYNRLLARGARFRLEGEVVRDVALAASGLLNPAIGGPSVYPPAPDFLFKPPASYGPKIWNTEPGAGQFRRAIYTFRFRSVPYPALQAFDTPPGDAPCTRRVRSNTPLQALVMLNEPLFFACARGLAEEALAQPDLNDEARIAFAFQRCVARKPDAEETTILQEFLLKQRERIGAGELKAETILRSAGADERARENEELAAWTLTARAILNLDETITRQ